MLVETKIPHFRGGYIGCLIRKNYLVAFLFVFFLVLKVFVKMFLALWVFSLMEEYRTISSS